MNSWYDFYDFSFKSGAKRSYNEAQLNASIARISKMLDQETTILGDSTKIFLGGFSQGCILALAIAMAYKNKLGGVIGLSGFMDEGIELDEAKKDMPIFLWHGKSDPLIPEGVSTKSYERLKKEGFKVMHTAEDYLEHSVSPKEMIAIKKFADTVMP